MEIILKELKKVALTLAGMDILIFIGGLLFRVNPFTMAISLVFGSLFTLANFMLLGSLCQKACTKTPLRAKRFMIMNYIARLLLAAVVIIASFELSYLNPVGVILPLFAPKITFFGWAIFETITGSGKKQKS